MFDELAHVPPAWRGSIAENYYYFTRGDQARKWLDVDLESLGFTAMQANRLRSNALQGLARQKPEEAIQRMGEVEMNASARQSFISNIFSSLGNDPEKADTLMAKLDSEEDRKLARNSLEAVQVGKPSEMAGEGQ